MSREPLECFFSAAGTEPPKLFTALVEQAQKTILGQPQTFIEAFVDALMEATIEAFVETAKLSTRHASVHAGMFAYGSIGEVANDPRHFTAVPCRPCGVRE